MITHQKYQTLAWGPIRMYKSRFGCPNDSVEFNGCWVNSRSSLGIQAGFEKGDRQLEAKRSSVMWVRCLAGFLFIGPLTGFSAVGCGLRIPRLMLDLECEILVPTVMATGTQCTHARNPQQD